MEWLGSSPDEPTSSSRYEAAFRQVEYSIGISKRIGIMSRRYHAGSSRCRLRYQPPNQMEPRQILM